MKVLHIIPGLDTGGAEASLFKLIKHFGDRDVEHVVCSLDGRGTFGPKLEALDVSVFAFSKRSIEFASSVPHLVKRLSPDIVQGWMHRGNLAASWSRMAGATRAPVLWNVRQTLDTIRAEKFGTATIIRAERMLSRYPSRIIYNSQISAEQHAAFGFYAAREKVIPNGFDVDLFRPDSIARARVREEIGIDESIPLIGLIGRYHPMKDHASFLNAARLIKVTRPEAMFLLAGRDTEKALPKGGVGDLDNAVIALGEREDVPAIMAALDIAVLSSSYAEGFSNVIGEAMASAVPCVATDVGDARRVIGNTGVVVPPRNSPALASAILSLIERPDRRHLGEQARQRIVSQFSVAATAAIYRDLYREIVGR